jgi:hypothetical protein
VIQDNPGKSKVIQANQTDQSAQTGGISNLRFQSGWDWKLGKGRIVANPSWEVERVTGIEPAWPVWKTGTLPLSYTRIREAY